MSDFNLRSTAPNQQSLDGRIYWDKAEGSLKVDTKVIAITPSSESGVEPDIQAVADSLFLQGGGIVTLRNGTYTLDNDLVLPDNTTLQGETAGGVIIDFNNTSSQISGIGSNVYNTGTISVSNLSTTVTGSGTGWNTSMIGQSILLSGIWYVITDVASATSLTIEIGFELLSISGQVYTIADPSSGVTLRNFTVQNSTHPNGAIYFQYAQYVVVDSINIFTSTIGSQFIGCWTAEFIGGFIGECDTGLIISTSSTWTVYNCEVYASTGDNMVLDNFNNVSFSNFTNSTAGGNGLTISNSTNWALYDFSVLSAAGNGIELLSSSSIAIFGSQIYAGGEDGIKLTSNNARVSIHNIVFDTNAGYGINIAASSNNSTIVTDNSFNSNTSGTIHDLGTNTVQNLTSISPTTTNLTNNTLLTANTEIDLVGSSGTLHFTAASDGADYNIFSSNGAQNLAFYGSAGNALGVKLLDGNLNIGAPTNNAGDAITTDATQTLTNKTLTTPTIASLTNATHNHQNSAGGGTLALASIDTTAWSSWTPTWTNISIGNAVVTGRYKQIGKYVAYSLVVQWGTGTSQSGSALFTIPVTAVAAIGSGSNIGTAKLFDGTNGFIGTVIQNNTVQAIIRWYNTQGTGLKEANISATSPSTWSTTTEWHMRGFYEAA